ncbi:MAG: hypothetical protein ACO31I_12800 [Prochlorotrichaceae cyanobacterium]
MFQADCLRLIKLSLRGDRHRLQQGEAGEAPGEYSLRSLSSNWV